MYDYDKTNKESIKKYAEASINKRFSDLYDISKLNPKDKGSVGNSYQSEYFGLPRNNRSEPDFVEAQLELKVFGYKLNKNKSYSACERLALSSISYMEFEEFVQFEKSELYNKCKDMLFIVFLLNPKSRIDSEIKYVRIYSIPALSVRDLKQIKHDYDYIVKKIQNGHASSLSEGDTELLAAAPTGDSRTKSKKAPQGDEARPRRFVLKNSYMTYLINNYILPEIPFHLPIRKAKDKLDINLGKCASFEEWLMKKESKYLNKTTKQLSSMKEIKTSLKTGYTSTKQSFYSISMAILGIKSNACPYLQKTNTVVKAIHISKNESLIESLSFPAFNFENTFDTDNWETTDVYEYLNEQRFLLMVFIDEGDRCVFKGHVFLKLTPEILDEKVKGIWRLTKERLIDLTFNLKLVKGKPYHINPFPGLAESKKLGFIAHIRPHQQKSTYRIKRSHISGVDSKAERFIEEHTKNDIYTWREGMLDKFGDELPNGDIMTSQSFWLNNSFVLSTIMESNPQWFEK